MPLTSEAWIWVFPLLYGLLALVRRCGGQAQRVSTTACSSLMALGFLLWGAAHASPSGSPSSTATSSRVRRSRRRPWSARCCSGSSATLPGIPALTVGQRRSVACPLDADLRSAVRRAGAARCADPDAGDRPRRRRSSFIVVSVATVSVIVLALARMWRLVDQVARPDRAARPRPLGGDGRALERRRDARRPERPRQLRQPGPAGDARLTTPRVGSGRHLLDVVVDGRTRSARCVSSNGWSSSATAAPSSSRPR